MIQQALIYLLALIAFATGSYAFGFWAAMGARSYLKGTPIPFGGRGKITVFVNHSAGDKEEDSGP